MAIADTISSMKTNISNAYDKLNEIGATLPENKNLANLTATIATVKGGSSDYTAYNTGTKKHLVMYPNLGGYWAESYLGADASLLSSFQNSSELIINIYNSIAVKDKYNNEIGSIDSFIETQNFEQGSFTIELKDKNGVTVSTEELPTDYVDNVTAVVSIENGFATVTYTFVGYEKENTTYSLTIDDDEAYGAIQSISSYDLAKVLSGEEQLIIKCSVQEINVTPTNCKVTKEWDGLELHLTLSDVTGDVTLKLFEYFPV